MIKFSLMTLLTVLSFLLYAEPYVSGFGQSFVKIKAGNFIMGTQDFGLLSKEVKPKKVNKLKKELPAHKVTISKGFYLASTEVTQGIWLELMGYKLGKKKRWEREDWKTLPVSKVNWQKAQEFIEVVNDMDENYHYRLPTEAEWEYAARAGTTGLRPFDYKHMDQYAWFRKSSGDKPMPVGSLKPNAWGLYDMVGNLWEWVDDSFDATYYENSPAIDPVGGELSSRKSMRGGSYHCTPERVRVAIRGSNIQHKSMSVLGFRLAADKK